MRSPPSRSEDSCLRACCCCSPRAVSFPCSISSTSGSSTPISPCAHGWHCDLRHWHQPAASLEERLPGLRAKSRAFESTPRRVRHLFQQLLGLVAPPFSEAFGRRLLKMIQLPRTIEAHRGRGVEGTRLLITFAQQAARLASLTTEADDALELLQAAAGASVPRSSAGVIDRQK